MNAAGQRDLLYGFGGNDTYYVDGTDLVYETAGLGTDRVLASTSYALKRRPVETLTTTNSALTTALNLTGNGFSQTIQGNAGANVINGGANAAGQRPSLWVRRQRHLLVDGTDLVTRRPAAPIGSWRARATRFRLGSVEVLATTNAALTTAINPDRQRLLQTIQGNAGANVINGGAGNDTLYGYGGADSFLFNTALGVPRPISTAWWISTWRRIPSGWKTLSSPRSLGRFGGSLLQGHRSP